MECDKNPFLGMSQDQIKKLDEVLRSDQAKALLEEATNKLLDTSKTLSLGSAIDNATTIPTIENLSDLETLDIEPSSTAEIITVCDEDDVNIATDMLQNNFLKNCEAELILLEHNYAMKPASSPQNIGDISSQNIDSASESDPNVPLSTTSTPTRRSQRQLDKIEREQLEKFKSENEKLQKKEKGQLEKQEVAVKNKSVDSHLGFVEDETQSKKQGQDAECTSPVLPSKEDISIRKKSNSGNVSELSPRILQNIAQQSKNMSDDHLILKLDALVKGEENVTEVKNETAKIFEEIFDKKSNIALNGKHSGLQKRKLREKNISPEELKTEKKSTRSPNKKLHASELCKTKSSPKKQKLQLASSNIIEKQYIKSNDRSLISSEEGEENGKSPNKTTRKRSMSSPVGKSKIASNHQKSPDSPTKVKRRKSCSFSGDQNEISIETQILSKGKQLVVDLVDCKESFEENLSKEQSLTPTPTTPLAHKANKGQKKVVKRESVNLGFEPALFSQPDVMVKVKSDDSPIKKDEKENADYEAMDVKEMESADEPHLPEITCDDKVFEAVFNDNITSVKMENEDMPTREIENSVMDQSNMQSEEEIPLNIKENTLNEAVSKETEKEPSQSIAEHHTISNIENIENSQSSQHFDKQAENNCIEKQPNVVMECIDDKLTLELKSDVSELPLSCDSKDMEQIFEEKLSEVLSNSNILQTTCQELIESNSHTTKLEISNKDISCDKDITYTAKSKNEKSSSAKPESAKPESAKPESAKPERKSRRIIKKKEFFEELSYKGGTNNVKEKGQTMLKTPERNEKADEPDTRPVIEICDDDPNDSDWSSEDDPEKLWCICRKPHNHRFMIQCDKCEDWFHGSCVGISRQQGRQLEKLKKEWKCPSCLKAKQAVTRPSKIPINENSLRGSPIKKKEVKQPRKVLKLDDQALKKNMKQIASPLKESCKRTANVTKSEFTGKVKTRLKNEELILASKPVELKQTTKDKDRSFDGNIKSVNKKIKLEKGQKESQKVASSPTSLQLKTIVPQKAIMTVSSTTSNKKILPSKDTAKSVESNISSKMKGNSATKEKVSKETKKKNSCVSCDKLPEQGSCYCSDMCIEKHATDCLKVINESKNSAKITDLSSQKLVVFDRHKGTVIAGENSPTASEIVMWLKANPNFMIACASDNHGKRDQSYQKPDSSTSDRRDEIDEHAKETVRVNVRKTLKNILEERCKNSDDIIVPEEDVRRIAMRIEEELFSLFRDNSFKYRAKYRSLMFNIKDPRNQGLFRKILRGKILPDRLVKMSTEELASVELAKWREQENQHCLDMIKRVQLEQQKKGGSLLIKKTHKGEVEIEGETVGVIEQDIPKTDLKLESETAEVEKPEIQEFAKDTTHFHRSHLFDLNCKICTGKMAPPPAEDSAKKMRVAHSISVDFSSPSSMDPVEKSVSRVVDGRSPISSTEDDSIDQEPTSTVSIGSPETNFVAEVSPTNHSKGKSKKKSSKIPSSVWKGFIFMQDVAKFVTSAYKVSGHTECLHQDIPDTIQVCGRIIPDQVWDYLSKIKQSGNKELIVIRFQPANREEAATYDSFYNYLNSRKRYGVVNNYSKKIKDFYILPLAATSPVPIVLMPFEGPGLPSRRPHLLLGVIVRHKMKQVSTKLMLAKNKEKKKFVTKGKEKKRVKEDLEIGDGSYTPPLETRSYTPPLSALPATEPVESSNVNVSCSPIIEVKPSPSKESTVFHSAYVPGIPSENSAKQKAEEDEFYEPSYTPPLETMPKSEDPVRGKEDDKPYDPEQDILRLPTTEQTEKSDILKETVTTVPSCDNLEKHKKILDELTRQYVETDRRVAALQQLISTPPEGPETNIQPPCNQHLDISNVTTTGMSSFLDLPKNLQEMINAVKSKGTFEQDHIVKLEERDIDMRSVINLPSDNDNGILSSHMDIDSHPKSDEPKILDTSEKFSSDTEEKNNSLGATPTPDDDEETCSVARPSDPRIKLRTSFQETNTHSEESPGMSLSSMSASELVARAQKQLAEMEAVEQVQNTTHKTPDSCRSATSNKFAEKVQSNAWPQFKEPPPPGIEPSDLPPGDTNFVTVSDSPPTQCHPVPPLYASTSSVDAQYVPHFTPPIPPPFPAHLPPLFSVTVPPPDIKAYPPHNIVSPGFLPPPLPSSPVIKKGVGSHSLEETWPPLQFPRPPFEEGEWQKVPPPPPPQWNEDWKPRTRSRRPSDHFTENSSRYYSQEQSEDYYHESYKQDSHSQSEWSRPHRRPDRGSWYKHSEREGRSESHWRGRRRPFFRRRGNNN